MLSDLVMDSLIRNMHVKDTNLITKFHKADFVYSFCSLQKFSFRYCGSLDMSYEYALTCRSVMFSPLF